MSASLSVIVDTETSGFPNSGPLDHPSQPHLVQLVGLLYGDDSGGDTVLRLQDVLIRPNGWVSSAGALAVHGISHERCMDEGIAEAEAIETLLSIASRADRLVAHNEQFDRKIIRIAIARYMGAAAAERWQQSPVGYCTLEAARRVLPLTSHKLADVYQHLFGIPPSNAHDALFDAMATRRVYNELRRRSDAFAAEIGLPIDGEEDPTEVLARARDEERRQLAAALG